MPFPGLKTLALLLEMGSSPSHVANLLVSAFHSVANLGPYQLKLSTLDPLVLGRLTVPVRSFLAILVAVRLLPFIKPIDTDFPFSWLDFRRRFLAKRLHKV